MQLISGLITTIFVDITNRYRIRPMWMYILDAANRFLNLELLLNKIPSKKRGQDYPNFTKLQNEAVRLRWGTLG